MRKAALFLLYAGLLVNGQELRWENGYDQEVNFACPAGGSISYIKSQHDNRPEDRMWEFGCKHTFDAGTECFWTPYVNDFDQKLNYECPSNYVVSGMSSYHSNKHEDRRWKFYCCRSSGYCNTDCQWTTYVNWFDEAFHWTVPNHNYLVGAESYHDNGPDDRRWMYKFCSQVQC
ncbi:Millepora cytotoxin-1 [Triplophysa tibetana]|uniref:Millepora cytotoxin-1 n=1 Tax=Triplophysa tibetana TaxID=1572043 RepID=A0A5A9PFQ8_9TELE|nr:Millepora cytotoxin-1 [Triplophysa tibetana]